MPVQSKGAKRDQDSLVARARLRLAAGAVLLAAVTAVPLYAQPTSAARPVTLTPLDENAKESLQGVSVNDSPEARKDIETARGMERQKDWNKAASWYQDVLEKYRSRVVAYRADKTNTINVYRGIIYQVQESLAKWPPEGIAAYRAKYESIAASQLQGAAADDYEALDAVFKNYFITESGKQAGLKLIDLHLEEGDFAAASWIGDRLLEWYPAEQLVVERPRLVYRTALAYHLHGDDKRASERADELNRKYPDATASIFGKDVVLSQVLAKQLAMKPPRGMELAADSYPMFCGSPDRSHISSAKGRMGAKVSGIDLPPRPLRQVSQQQGQQDPRKVAEREDALGLSLGIMPVVDGDQLFFQDGSRVYAVGLESGLPLPGWANTYGGDHPGRYQLKGASSPRTQQLTVTLTDSAVLAIMGQSNRAAFVLAQQGQDVPNATDRGTRLVCLDRETGKERWKINPANLTDDKLKDEDRERVRSLDLSGSPLVVGDSIYVIGRGGKDPQFENCYVIAFDLATGNYKWSSLVASANSAFNPYDENSQPSNTLSHLAYSSGRVFVLTNLGALAAVDAYSGSVVWLSIYPRDSTVDGAAMAQMMWRGRNGQSTGQQLKPWEYNPVFVQNGKLFILPVDSKYLMVYDAGTGSEVKSIDVTDFERSDGFERPTTILAILGDKLLLSGRHQVINLNWATYDPQKSLSQNLMTDGWASAVFLRTGGPQDTIRGRAFVTTDSVFVPTDVSLFRIALGRQGMLEDVYPTHGKWDTDSQGPGNVLVTSEHVVIASTNRVDIYTDMKVALAKLDAEVAKAPTAAEPRLRYSEVMFAAGQLDLALSKMKEGVDLIGGSAAMLVGAPRRRVFTDCITYAQKLAKDKRGESNDMAAQFYQLASSAAETASEQVNYRISRARFLRETDDYTQAVRLYQEILSRPDLRIVTTVGPEDGSGNANMVQAGIFAEAAIANILLTHREAYAPVDVEARAARDAAHQLADPDKLLEVAHTYPNATAVAPAAMLEAAELYESARKPSQATHVLRQIYRKYGASDDRAGTAGKLPDRGRIVEALVRNYLTLPGGLDVATARLKQAVGKPLNLAETKLERPLVTPDGQKIENVTFAQALATLISVNRPAGDGETLPDFHIPAYRRLTEAEQDAGKPLPDPFIAQARDASPLVIDDVAALLTPPTELAAFARPDRLVTAGAGNDISLFAAGQSKPQASNHDLTDSPRGIAWVSSSFSMPAKTPTTLPAGAPAAAVVGAVAGKPADVLVWSGKEILLARGDSGQTVWKCDLSKLPAIDVVTTGPQDAGVGGEDVAASQQADANDVQNFNGPNGRIFARRRINGAVVVNRGFRQQVAVQDAIAQPPPADGPEQVSFVNPLGDRVLIGTSNGRLLCLSGMDGKTRWQSRLSNHVFDRMVASEDFTVIRLTQSGVHLLAVDNYDGQVQMKKTYPADGLSAPINMALSADGILVWTLASSVCAKDLFEAGNVPKYEFPQPLLGQTGMAQGAQAGQGGQGVPQFLGCGKTGQLIIRGDKILAVEQGGRYVSIRDLQTGALSHHQDKGKSVESLLQTAYVAPQQAQQEVPVWVRLAGGFMYVVGPGSLMGYNIDRPADDHWKKDFDQYMKPNFRDAFVSRDFFILLNEPGARRRGENATAPLYRLDVFSRNKVGESKVESGLNFGEATIVDPSGIIQWQAADGGVYILTGDHKLRLVKGAREN